MKFIQKDTGREGREISIFFLILKQQRWSLSCNSQEEKKNFTLQDITEVRTPPFLSDTFAVLRTCTSGLLIMNLLAGWMDNYCENIKVMCVFFFSV